MIELLQIICLGCVITVSLLSFMLALLFTDENYDKFVLKKILCNYQNRNRYFLFLEEDLYVLNLIKDRITFQLRLFWFRRQYYYQYYQYLLIMNNIRATLIGIVSN